MIIKKVVLDGVKDIPIINHTSKGKQVKWFANGKWYKVDCMGYEALAEVVISRLLAKSNIKQFVKYVPVCIQKDLEQYTGCYSNSFLKANEQLVTVESLYRCIVPILDVA